MQNKENYVVGDIPDLLGRIAESLEGIRAELALRMPPRTVRKNPAVTPVKETTALDPVRPAPPKVPDPSVPGKVDLSNIILTESDLESLMRKSNEVQESQSIKYQKQKEDKL